ncbi:hypothetical protein HOA91_00770 [Candidatus Woesearchaeota archaeon]|jgi:hypothetical protein|nr:hypothetical protein [Candidatus Woesearchaeota archaeon]
MSSKSNGVMLIFLGVGSFVLPFFGLQFKILTLFGGFQWVISLILAGLGLFLMVRE